MGVDDGVTVGVVERPVGLLADVDPVEGRLREEDLAVRDQFGQEAVEEGEKQRRDVIAVGVGVGHDDDAVISELADIECLADAAAEGGDDIGQLLVLEHLGCGCALDVQYLAAQGEDRLPRPVAPLLRGAAGGVPLDDEQLAPATPTAGAIAQLARQVQPVGGGALARDRLVRGAARLPRARGQHDPRDDRLGRADVVVQPPVQAALVIFDVFKGHMGEAVQSLLEESRIFCVLVPNTRFERKQCKPFKDMLRKGFLSGTVKKPQSI